MKKTHTQEHYRRSHEGETVPPDLPATERKTTASQPRCVVVMRRQSGGPGQVTRRPDLGTLCGFRTHTRPQRRDTALFVRHCLTLRPNNRRKLPGPGQVGEALWEEGHRAAWMMEEDGVCVPLGPRGGGLCSLGRGGCRHDQVLPWGVESRERGPRRWWEQTQTYRTGLQVKPARPSAPATARPPN